MPESEIPCEVYSNSTRYILHLTKLDPNIEAWGEFEWNFKVLEKNNAYVNNNNWIPNNSGTQGNPIVDSNLYGEVVQDDFNDGVLAGADEKACGTCTFLNPPHLTHCDCCGTAM